MGAYCLGPLGCDSRLEDRKSKAPFRTRVQHKATLTIPLALRITAFAGNYRGMSRSGE